MEIFKTSVILLAVIILISLFNTMTSTNAVAAGTLNREYPMNGKIIGASSLTVSADWTAIGNGLNGLVYAMAEKDGVLYAGGDFQTAGFGVWVNFVAM
jgi:hypothetical protein